MRIKRVIDAVNEVKLIKFDFNEDNAQDKFNLWWEPIKSVLDAAVDLRITGRRFDRAVGKVIALGDLVYQGQVDQYNEFVAEFRDSLDTVADGILMFMSWVDRWIKRRERKGKPVTKLKKTNDIFEQTISIIDWVVGDKAVKPEF